MRRWLVVAALALCGACPASAGKPVLFTSTRYVMDMAFAGDGTLWVATRGGVLRRGTDGSWRKFTMADGLPSNEPRQVTPVSDADSVEVAFPRSSAVWSQGKWRVGPAVPWKANMPDRPAPPPPSISGTHLVTRCRGGKREIAALFGAGLYEYSNGKWAPMDVNLPDKVSDITAIASNGADLWVGTRREGVWQYTDKTWVQHLQRDDPYDHNIQCIASYRGNIYFSTLGDGLVVRTGDRWQHITPSTLSSEAPRQMVEFAGSLWVRHGDGKTDQLTGDKWTLNACSSLPRKQASALSSDGKRLYVGQYGGWSEYDGKSWTHHLKHPELQGLEITAILPQENTIWLGTQGRGLAEVDRSSNTIRMHDERNGLADDWIRSLTSAGGIVYAGTFVGGLLAEHDGKWSQVSGTEGSEVTDLRADTHQNLLIAARTGAYQLAAGGKLTQLDSRISEVQAIYPVSEGIWIGTRTGIWFLPR